MSDSEPKVTRPEPYRQRFDDYVSVTRWQHDLIDRKGAWLLTSQGILLAALGFMLRAPVSTVVEVVAWLGLAIAVGVAIGLAGNISAKVIAWQDYRSYEKDHRDDDQVRWAVWRSNKVELGVRGWTTWLGIVADAAIALAFAVAWIVVLANASDIVEAARTALSE